MPAEHDKPAISLVQITDCHLFSDPTARLVGMNCSDSLDAVLELIESEQPATEGFLCTGDLVQDGSEAGYRELRHKLDEFERPYHWLCGNHDQRENMLAVLGDTQQVFIDQVMYGNWQILMLDSQVPGQIYGNLEQGELAALRKHLKQSEEAGMFSLICLHHNPVPVKAAWLQRHSLKNPEQLFAVLADFSHVKGVLHGHIHQDKHDEVDGIPVWSTPSTCVQFHPEYDEFTIHELNPGYRWLVLGADGVIKTGVRRVSGQALQIDLDSAGY